MATGSGRVACRTSDTRLPQAPCRGRSANALVCRAGVLVPWLVVRSNRASDSRSQRFVRATRAKVLAPQGWRGASTRVRSCCVQAAPCSGVASGGAVSGLGLPNPWPPARAPAQAHSAAPSITAASPPDQVWISPSGRFASTAPRGGVPRAEAAPGCTPRPPPAPSLRSRRPGRAGRGPVRRRRSARAPGRGRRNWPAPARRGP